MIVPDMSIKKKITSLLFRQTAETADSPAPPAPEPVEEEIPEIPAGVPSQFVLELPAEHPLYRLYDQRRQEAGYLPAPRLCLDEEGSLPPETARTELARLQGLVTSACNARLKEAAGQNRSSPGKKRRKRGEEGQEEREMPEEGPPALDALPWLFLSADKLLAWLLVFPPIGGGEELSRDMLCQALAEGEISFGVDTQVVDRIAHGDRKYFHLYLVARGKPAFNGKNGNIVDNFPRVI